MLSRPKRIGVAIALGAVAAASIKLHGPGSPQPLREPVAVPPDARPLPARTSPLALPATIPSLDTLLDLARRDAARLIEQWRHCSAETRLTLGPQLIALLAADSPQLAALLAADLPPGGEQQTALSLVLHRYVEADAQDAVRWFLSLPPEIAPSSLLAQLASALAERDPITALELVNRLGEPDRRSAALRGVIERWCVSDPEMTTRLIDTLATDERAEVLLATIVKSVAAVRPAEALTQALALLRGPERERTVEAIGETWARVDLDGALARVQTQASHETGGAFLRGVILTVAETSPATASALVSDLEIGADRDRVAELIVTQWAARDPAAAAAWAATFPSGPLRESTLSAVASAWAPIDAFALERWLERLPSDAARDLAYQRAGKLVAAQDPRQAAAWIGRVRDPRLVDTALREVGDQLTPATKDWPPGSRAAHGIH
jgi:hypothetical protein